MKRTKDWLKFFTGLLIMAFIFGFFASGYSLPGACGKVLRHNQKNSIDASPLFYTEVENMAELEDGVREMMEKAKTCGFTIGALPPRSGLPGSCPSASRPGKHETE